ncbi:RDD family protein [Novosphingobium sp. MMS21-SN21R]|uniref:RDD family protein n=1 Tax=Novosphingobium sp. MMS21-SN21R TaxID=2969298 RepID=UPI002888D2B0|nr:RDD family protein [Novosphingobium sp. MMS21-SN21R]MDT0509311.1 RDD family protein [Novosphingobium sp. MMS21-SN21R]
MAIALPFRKGRAPRTPLDHEDRRRRMVITPEGVPLPFLLASRGARAAALFLDLAMIVGAMIGMTLILMKVAEGVGLDVEGKNPAAHAMQALGVLWIVALFLFRNAWFLFFELGARGATPGKRITGIRVAARASGSSGARLTTEAVIARNLVRDIELFMPLVFFFSAWAEGSDTDLAGWAGLAWFLIFAFFPFFNRDRLRCGDLIAGTWVVEAPKRKLEQALSTGTAARGTSAETGAQYRFSDADLAVYGEMELQVLERVLRDSREEAMRDVAQTICRKIGWSAGSGDERAFLEAYYAQLRARLETGMRFGRRKANKHSS